jgi:outer-membrane receptor for ferric coprogen and ferric-rhodotorulic acid
MVGVNKTACVGNRGKVLAAALMVTTALATTLVVSPVLAQQATAATPEVAQLQGEQNFDIPAQPLTDALVAFGQQSGVQVTVAGTVARNVSAPAVQGIMTSEQALRQLLAGSGLIYTMSGSTVAIERPAVQGADGTIVLDPVIVEGQAFTTNPGQTEGTNSYIGSTTTIGSKMPLEVRDVPQSVSVITRQQIEDQNLTTVEDAVRRETGITVRTTGPQDQIYSRGYQMDTVQADGAPLPVFNQLTTALDLAMYDRIEVLRGPNGVLNGTGEPAGSINLVSKRPLDRFKASGAAMIGSWNYHRAEADVTGPLVESGRLRGRIVGAFQDRDYFYDVADENKKFVYGSFEVDLTERTTLSAGSAFQDRTSTPFWGLPAYSDGTLLDVDRSTFLGADWGYLNQETSDNFIEIEHQFDNGSTAKATSRYTHRDGSAFFLTPFGINASTGNTTLRTSDYSHSADGYYLDANATMPLHVWGQEQNIAIGANYRQHNSDSLLKYDFSGSTLQNIFDPDYNISQTTPATFSDSSTTTTEYGNYGQIKLKPGVDWATILLGGRLTWWRSETDNHRSFTESTYSVHHEITPFAGLTFDLNQNVSAYGSYAEIFQPQTSTRSDGSIIAPRVGSQYEVGLKGEFFDKGVIAHLSAFQITDENRAITDPDNTLFSIAAGEQRSRGIEAQVAGEPVPGWHLSAGYSYTNTEILKAAAATDAGKSFTSFLPEHTFKLWSKYQSQEGPLEPISIGFGATVVSDFYAESGGVRWTQSGYAVFDAQLGYQLTDEVEATLSVNNLLDKKYYESVWEASNYNYYGPPRSAWLTLRTSF